MYESKLQLNSAPTNPFLVLHRHNSAQ